MWNTGCRWNWEHGNTSKFRTTLLMQERKAQWEADVKETRNKNLERQKNASSEIVMNADKARTNQNKK